MKEHMISYLLDTPQWWSGLNLTNHSFKATSVGIDYFNHFGQLAKQEEISLGVGEQKKFGVKIPYDPQGWGWARAISDNNVTISQYMGETGVSSMTVPIEKRDVIISNVVECSTQPVKVYSTGFVRLIDPIVNNYLTRGYFGVAQLVARKLHYKYPDRKAQMLELVDASAEYGYGTGHPGASHADGYGCDWHPFTHGDTNHVQIRMPGEPIVKMWDDNNKLTDLFDAERTMEFLLMLRNIYPFAELIFHKDAKEAIKLAAWRVYGNDMRDKFDSAGFINWDDDPNDGMSHRRHIHCKTFGAVSSAEVMNKDLMI